MITRTVSFASVLALSALISHADTLVLNPSADTFFRAGLNNSTNFGTQAIYDIYQNGTARNYFAYTKFDLSALAGATITSATLTFTYNGGGTRTDSITTGRFAAYGLLEVECNTPQTWTETGLVVSGGTENIGAEYIAANNVSFDTATRTVSFDGVGEVITGTGVGATATLNTSSSLVSFLQGRLASLTSVSATFIIDSPTNDAGRGYALGSREAITGMPVLTIEYTAVPEPSAFALLAGLAGVGCVGLRRRRRA